MMDHLVERLRTPEECESFARNAAARKRPDLVLEALRKGVEMKAAQQNAATPLETEAFTSLFAHEAVLTHQRGKKTRATRAWAIIRHHGVVEAINRTIDRPTEAADYETLREMGIAEWSFEALILRHPEAFTPEAVALATARTAERT